jgi:hypothetical protein
MLRLLFVLLVFTASSFNACIDVHDSSLGLLHASKSSQNADSHDDSCGGEDCHEPHCHLLHPTVLLTNAQSIDFPLVPAKSLSSFETHSISSQSIHLGLFRPPRV